MSEIYSDRYRKTATANIPGDTAEYGHQCTPNGAGDVLMGASGYLLAAGKHLPLSIELADTGTYGLGNVAYAYAEWDDGAGGTGTPGTAYLTCVFAKAVQL